MQDESKPRRGSIWKWFFGLGLVLLLALGSFPFWGGGLAAGIAAKRFNGDRAGRLEVGSLDLSWTGRQAAREVRLYDPEGQPIAEVTAELPSLLALARGGGKRMGEVLITATADLVADDAGVSNLQRALAPKDPNAERPKASEGGGESDAGGLDELDLFIGLDCPRLTWSDARTRALGEPFRLSDVTGKVIVRPGEPIAVRLDGAVSGAGAAGGTLHVKADVDGVLSGEAPRAEVEADVAGLPTGLVDALAGLDGLLGPTLGEAFDLEARADGGLDAGRVLVEVKGDAGSLSFLGQLEDGVLSAYGPDEGLDVRIADPGVVLDRYLVPALGEGGAMQARGLVLSLREFDLPVPDPEAAGGAFDQAAFLEAASASFGLTLDSAEVSLPDLPGGPLEVANVLFSAMVEPGAPFRLSLSSDLPATVSGGESGAIDLSVDVEGLATLLAHGTSGKNGDAGEPGGTGEPGGGLPDSGWEARFRGKARGLETARVDALLGQQGLVVDAIGAASAVTFSGVWPPSEEPVTLTLDAPGANLAFTGQLRDGVLIASGEDSIEARLPLSPLLSERIVGPLVPIMVQLEKPAGVAPLGLAVSDFRLPLDGDLSKLSATLQLELGEVAYELVPGLADLMAAFGEKNLKQTASLEPFSLRIEDGVARYGGLSMQVEGQRIGFDGSVNLATRELDLDASVPLAVFGDGVVRELDKVREYLDPNLAVPVRLTGGWKAPKVRVSDQFLQTTLKEAARGAAEGAVKKGLFDLLEKELGGD